MIVNENGCVTLDTAKAFLPLLKPCRFKGAKGGRGSGKSHFFAELAVEEMIADHTVSFACMREVQKDLRHSAKRLIESKIREMGAQHLFRILDNEIRRVAPAPCQDPGGIMIFQGLQDHTADSIKSLEGFQRVWVEEAQSISKRSMDLLVPTMRAGSQLWFSWNPRFPDDAIEKLFESLRPHESALVHVNFLDNPMCPQETLDDAERCRANNPDDYGHIWLGEFDIKSDSIIFNDAYEIREFEPDRDWSIAHGLDWGFSQDPLAAVQTYYHEDTLYIRREYGGVRIELDETADGLKDAIPGIEKHVIRADSSHPSSISYCRRDGLPLMTAVDKWPGSIEDGIKWLRALRCIVIHPDCIETAQEMRKYSYKVDTRTGDVLPVVVDKFNHYIDAIRYAVAPLIQLDSNSFKGL